MTEFPQYADIAKRLTSLSVYLCCLLVLANLISDWQLLNSEVWVTPPWRWIFVHGLVMGGVISCMLNGALTLGLNTMPRISGGIYLLIFLALWIWLLNLNVSFPLLYRTMPSEFVPYLESVLGPDGTWIRNDQGRILALLGASGLFIQFVLLAAGWLAWPWVYRPSTDGDATPATSTLFSPKLFRLIVLMVGALLLQQSAYWGWHVVLDTFQQFGFVLVSLIGLAVLGSIPYGWGVAGRDSLVAVVFTAVWCFGCCMIVALVWFAYDWSPERFPYLGSFVWPTIFLLMFGLFLGMALGQLLPGTAGYLARKFPASPNTTSLHGNIGSQRREQRMSMSVPVEIGGVAATLLLLPLAVSYLTTSYNLTVLSIADKNAISQSKLAAEWLRVNENEKSVVVYESGKTLRRPMPLISIGASEVTRLLVTSRVHQSPKFTQLADLAALVVGVDANEQAIADAQNLLFVTNRQAVFDVATNDPPVLTPTLVWATPVNDFSLNKWFGSYIPQWDLAAQPLKPADWDAVTEIALVGGHFAPTDWHLIPSNVRRIIFSGVEVEGPVQFSSEDRFYHQVFFDQCKIDPEVLSALSQVMEIDVRFLSLTPLVENPDLLSRLVFDGNTISLYELPEYELKRFEQVPEQYRGLIRLARLDQEHWQIKGVSMRELILKASIVPANWKTKAFQSNDAGRITGIVLDSVSIAALLSSQESVMSGQEPEGGVFQTELDWVIVSSSVGLDSEEVAAIVRHFVERARWVVLAPGVPESSILNPNPIGVLEKLREWPSLHSQGRGLILTRFSHSPWSLFDARTANYGIEVSDAREFDLEYWESVAELAGINVLVLDSTHI